MFLRFFRHRLYFRKMMRPIVFLVTALKGAAMGMAEVVPGVSGGTLAFITGIYERLLNAIKAFGPEAIEGLRENGLKGFWKAIDGTFLVSLLTGMAVGIIVGIFGITYLLDNHPVLLWSFFFGLIIASAVYIARQIQSWAGVEFVLLIMGTAFAYYITTLPVGEASADSLFYVFLSGAIAICALILPGISGSFILLLMGMYTVIIPTIKVALKTFDSQALLVVGVFAAGCLTGLLLFSRLLSWTFKNYHGPTLAILTGFMIGSLNKIWPWRIPLEWLRDTEGTVILDDLGMPKKVILDENVLPSVFAEQTGNDPQIIAAILCAVLGFAVVWGLSQIELKKEA